MNNKVNYTAVGLLVLFGFVLMMAFTYWLLKPSADAQTKKYLIHFDESVLGLNVDAPVKYRGINVGKVSQLRINPNNSEQVEVLVTILESTPIKSSTVAKLTAQGITGLSYINLSLGDNNAPSLTPQKGEKYAVIKTVPSFFENFEQSLGTVTTRLSKTLSKTEELLNDENQQQIALLLQRSASVMEKTERLLSDEAINDFHESMHNLASASKKVDTMLPKVELFVDKSMLWEEQIAKTFNSIMGSYLGIRESADQVNKAVKSGQFNLKEITGDITVTMNSTLIELQHLLVQIDHALKHYERSPSDILFKQEQIKKGPGEK